MSHMLDTCTWLRTVGLTEQLNVAARAVLTAQGNAPFALSAISVWEVCTKVRKKPQQLQLTLSLAEWLRIALQPRFIRIIPIDDELSRLSNELPGELHDDPADRLIVATARRHDLVLLTSDEKILAYPHVRSLDTR